MMGIVIPLSDVAPAYVTERTQNDLFSNWSGSCAASQLCSRTRRGPRVRSDHDVRWHWHRPPAASGSVSINRVQQQSAATRLTFTDSRSLPLTWPPAQTTFVDFVADSSHPEARRHTRSIPWISGSVEFRKRIGNQVIETFVFLPKALVEIFCFINAARIQRLLCHRVYLMGKISQPFIEDSGAGILQPQLGVLPAGRSWRLPLPCGPSISPSEPSGPSISPSHLLKHPVLLGV